MANEMKQDKERVKDVKKTKKGTQQMIRYT